MLDARACETALYLCPAFLGSPGEGLHSHPSHGIAKTLGYQLLSLFEVLLNELGHSVESNTFKPVGALFYFRM